MSDWVVGKREFNGARLYDGATETTTGTATLYYVRNNAGTAEYLQSDASTWSSSYYAFTVTHTADLGWVHDLTVPSSADGYTVSWALIHSAEGLIAGDTHYVTTADIDDANARTDIKVKLTDGSTL